MSSSLIQIIRFIALVATQLLVLNKIQFSGYFNPYIYILFILLLPLKTPPVTMLITGFALGFIIDLYTGIMGIHAAATLFISFFRNRIIRVTTGLTPDDLITQPGLRDLGSFRFIYYAGLMALIHHLILFFGGLHHPQYVRHTAEGSCKFGYIFAVYRGYNDFI